MVESVRQERAQHVTSLPETADEGLDLATQASRPDESTTSTILRGQKRKEPPSVKPLSNTFIGDSNPESALRAGSPTTAKVRDSHLGVWVHDGDGTPERIAQSPEHTKIDEREFHQPVSVGEAALNVPHSTRRALIRSYSTKIHPLIPLLHQTSTSLEGYPANSVVILALCLAACKDDESSPFLRLTEGGTVLPVRHFASSLYDALTSALLAQNIDRIEKIEALALLSLHHEGPNGLEQASLHLLHAIHQAQSIGLHIECSRRRRLDAGQGARLFWCLWSLDRLNSSIGGRPILVVDRDIGVPWPLRHLEEEGLLAFAKWLEISQTLASVIDYYRPTMHSGATGWEHDYPSFEEIVGEAADEKIGEPALSKCLEIFESFCSSCIGILEVYYNAVAILSCRSRTAGTASSTRQELAALQIEKISQSLQSISYLPLIPYAISLTMTVAYRQMRHTKLSSHREIAKRSISNCCQALESMKDKWWSAGAMAKLGTKAIGKPSSERNERFGRSNILRNPFPDTLHREESGSSATTFVRPAEESSTENRGSELLQQTASFERSQGTEASSLDNVAQEHPSEPSYSFDELDRFLGEYADLSFPTELYSSFGDLTNTNIWSA
ncbi:MAG: hypothetical protein Q9160_002903 [Pyrenula sp. 1 TL-2023]